MLHSTLLHEEAPVFLCLVALSLNAITSWRAQGGFGVAGPQLSQDWRSHHTFFGKVFMWNFPDIQPGRDARATAPQFSTVFLQPNDILPTLFDLIPANY